jgi:hypothetical protein
MVLLGDEAQVKLVLIHLEIVLMQDRCMAQNLFWTHPMEHLGDVSHDESCFDLFSDGVSASAR